LQKKSGSLRSKRSAGRKLRRAVIAEKKVSFTEEKSRLLLRKKGGGASAIASERIEVLKGKRKVEGSVPTRERGGKSRG